jgi:hypothetical protein
MLRPGGRAFLSFADLTTPLGWARFEKQSHHTAGGFYCERQQAAATTV